MPTTLTEGDGSRGGFQGVAQLGSPLCQAASKHYESITSMTCLNNSPPATLSPPLPQIALGWALPNCYYARARTRPGCSIIYHKML